MSPRFLDDNLQLLCVLAIRQDNPCPQKTKTFKASSILCDFGSVVCAATGAFSKTVLYTTLTTVLSKFNFYCKFYCKQIVNSTSGCQ